MSGKSSTVAVPHNPIREFANSNLTPKQSRQRASTLLNDGELARNVQELTTGEQARFLDKVDQVRRDHSFFS